jgi:hypothetical protein
MERAHLQLVVSAGENFARPGGQELRKVRLAIVLAAKRRLQPGLYRILLLGGQVGLALDLGGLVRLLNRQARLATITPGHLRVAWQ